MSEREDFIRWGCVSQDDWQINYTYVTFNQVNAYFTERPFETGGENLLELLIKS